MPKNELYNILKVQRTATEEEIKKAYYGLVRQHPPEKDPEGFKKIRSAFETLTDKKQREQYDSIQNYSQEIIDLFNEGLNEYGNANYGKAIDRFKKVVVLAPNYYMALNYLGLAYLAKKDFGMAKTTYKDLCAKVTDDPVYFYNYALALLGEPDINNFNYSNGSAAEEMYKKALSLDPKETNSLMGMAWLEYFRQNNSKALEWSEKAINADNQVDIQDLEFFFFQIHVYINQNNMTKVSNIISRIRAIVPADDSGIKEYVAFEFAKYASILFDNKVFDIANKLVKVAKEYSNNPELSEFAKAANEADAINRQIQKLQNEYGMEETLKAYCFYLAAKYFGEYIENEQTLLNNMENNLAYAQISEVKSTISKIKNSYRAIYNLNKKYFDDIYNACSQSPSYGSSSGYSSSGGSGYNSSGCFIATAVYGDYNIPEVLVLRQFRDVFLEKYSFGRLFIKYYYKYGPAMAERVKNNPVLVSIIKRILDAMVALLKRLLT